LSCLDGIPCLFVYVGQGTRWNASHDCDVEECRGVDEVDSLYVHANIVLHVAKPCAIESSDSVAKDKQVIAAYLGKRARGVFSSSLLATLSR
jgi:hypothetical protein